MHDTGMGDILSLVEMAESSIKENEAEAMMARIMKNKFDFDDFLKQYRMVSGMGGGGMSSVMKLLPGAQLCSDLMIKPACLWLEGVNLVCLCQVSEALAPRSKKDGRRDTCRHWLMMGYWVWGTCRAACLTLEC